MEILVGLCYGLYKIGYRTRLIHDELTIINYIKSQHARIINDYLELYTYQFSMDGEGDIIHIDGRFGVKFFDCGINLLDLIL